MRKDRWQRPLTSLEVARYIDLCEKVNAERVKMRRDHAKSKNILVKGSLKKRLQEQRIVMREQKRDQLLQTKMFPIERSSFGDIKPSLVVHLFATVVSFDNQPTSYPYTPVIKRLLACIDEQVIPADLVEMLDEPVGQFYDGCLVVEVRNYRGGSGVEVRRVLLRPTQESIYADLHVLNAQSGGAKSLVLVAICCFITCFCCFLACFWCVFVVFVACFLR